MAEEIAVHEHEEHKAGEHKIGEHNVAEHKAGEHKAEGHTPAEPKQEGHKAEADKEPEHREQGAAEHEASKKKKKKFKGITTKAKKKTAVARAVLHKGKGRITVNKMNIALLQPRYVNAFVHEPLDLSGDLWKEVDVAISVKGSGVMSQAVAARAALAKALVQYSKDKKLKDVFLKYDRMLLVDDFRRKEPKKPLGRGARAKRQLSRR